MDPSQPLELSLEPDLGYPPPDPLFKTTVKQCLVELLVTIVLVGTVLEKILVDYLVLGLVLDS